MVWFVSEKSPSPIDGEQRLPPFDIPAEWDPGIDLRHELG
jgi:hypothetical protein